MMWADLIKPVRAWGTGECFIGPSRARREPEVEVHNEQAEWRDREIDERGARIAELLAVLETQDKARLEAVDMARKARFDLETEQKARSEAFATIQRLKAEMIERGKQFDAEKSQYRESFKEQMKGLERGLSQTLSHNERLKTENSVLKIKLARKEKLVERDDARPLSDFEMSARAAMCLDKMGIKTIGQLLGHSRKDLLRIPNFGVGSANEVEELLESMGLKLS